MSMAHTLANPPTSTLSPRPPPLPVPFPVTVSLSVPGRPASGPWPTKIPFPPLDWMRFPPWRVTRERTVKTPAPAFSSTVLLRRSATDPFVIMTPLPVPFRIALPAGVPASVSPIFAALAFVTWMPAPRIASMVLPVMIASALSRFTPAPPVRCTVFASIVARAPWRTTPAPTVSWMTELGP